MNGNFRFMPQDRPVSKQTGECLRLFLLECSPRYGSRRYKQGSFATFASGATLLYAILWYIPTLHKQQKDKPSWKMFCSIALFLHVSRIIPTGSMMLRCASGIVLTACPRAPRDYQALEPAMSKHPTLFELHKETLGVSF